MLQGGTHHSLIGLPEAEECAEDACGGQVLKLPGPYEASAASSRASRLGEDLRTRMAPSRPPLIPVHAVSRRRESGDDGGRRGRSQTRPNREGAIGGHPPGPDCECSAGRASVGSEARSRRRSPGRRGRQASARPPGHRDIAAWPAPRRSTRVHLYTPLGDTREPHQRFMPEWRRSWPRDLNLAHH